MKKKIEVLGEEGNVVSALKLKEKTIYSTNTYSIAEKYPQYINEIVNKTTKLSKMVKLSLNEVEDIDKYKLCYVDDHNCAWFTPIELSKQWGDDWDDAPYDCNAGDPYDDCDGKKYELVKLCFEKNGFVTPSDRCCNNCIYSVKDINSKEVPWLDPYYGKEGAKPIYAGATIRQFIELCSLNDTQVFAPIKIK